MAAFNRISVKRVPVIYYHSVGPVKPGWAKDFLTLSLSVFEEQLRFIAKHFTTIHLREYYEILTGAAPSPRRPLVITFDDGYLDNWQYAWPLLKKYGLKGTIFISPEFVDNRSIIRPGLDDTGVSESERQALEQRGFLSWDELRIMESSGIMDIQSHTMTHTKYPVSDKIVNFHRPGSDCLYCLWNAFPGQKPYYIDDPLFERLLPFGYPLFEMKSSLLARIVVINPAFIDHCTRVFSGYDFAGYRFEDAFQQVRGEYERYRKSGSLILSTEGDEEYARRINYEIAESKRIIEEKLDKKVEFLCWPHGDNNRELHRAAIEAGYLMTTTGNLTDVHKKDNSRIQERLALDISSGRKRLKSVLKLKALSGESPYSEILWFSRLLKAAGY